MSQYAPGTCLFTASLSHHCHLPLSSLIPPQAMSAFPSTPSSCLAPSSSEAQVAAASTVGACHGGTFLLGESPPRPTPCGCNTKFYAGGSGADPRGARGEPWVWNKARESFFSCPALESVCEQDDLFLQRFITWQNLGGGFLQASSTFLTHKPKSCHISSPFSKAWGHEEKVTKFLETWRWGERVYFLPAK